MECDKRIMIQDSTRGPMPPYFTYRDFLDSRAHASLFAWAIANEALFEPSYLLGGVYDPNIRVSLIVPSGHPSPWKRGFAKRVRELVPDLFTAVGLKPFEAEFIELEMAAHNDGAHFGQHIDTATGSRREAADRILSGVYYFRGEPKRFTGGEIRLHRLGSSNNADDFVDIEPEQNSFLTFPSWAKHEVRQISCPSRQFRDSRFAINCWLRKQA